MRACSQTFQVHVVYGLGIECHPTDLGDAPNGVITGYLTLTRHESKANVTVVLFASLLDADDLASQSGKPVDRLYNHGLNTRHAGATAQVN